MNSCYTIIRSIGKAGTLVLCELPKREYLHVGEYVVYAGPNGTERIGLVVCSDYDVDSKIMRSVWNGERSNLIAELRRYDIDWPDDVMTEEPQMPDVE